MYNRGFGETQISKFYEAQAAMASGTAVQSGFRYVETNQRSVNVDDILLPRPFILREPDLGPWG
jgi:hypothetical protein